MAGPNLPSMTELAQMEFMSPMMFNQGQQQIGLANQFAQQGLESGALNNQAQTLANQFAEQMSPLKIDQQTLNNEGLGFDIMSKGVKARTDVELEDEEKKARRQKLLAAASDDELKALQAQAEAQMLHPDPAIREVGKKKLEGSWAETQRRLKAADALEKVEAANAARLEGIRMAQEGANGRNAATNASGEERARITAEARKAKSNGGAEGILANVQAGKMNFEKAATAFEVMASMEEDPQRAAAFSAMAQKFARANVTSKSAMSGTKVDLEQFGIGTFKQALGIGGERTVVPGGMPAGGGNAPPMSSGRGDPPAGSGIVTPEQACAATAITQMEEEYARTPPGPARQVLAEEIRKARSGNSYAVNGPSGAAAQPAAKPAGPPTAGTVYKGYRFKGGDPSKRENWIKE